MARYVLPVVGAVVGFYVGGPSGAAWGWQIGAAAGSLVDPQTIKGPSIGDIAQQTSQAGVPRPIVFGTSQPIMGNVITSGPPVIVKNKSSGKGGPKVETESVFRTYSIRICEGPIDGVLRVWRNNILVYDARPGGDLDAPTNAKFLATARFFLGEYDQMPSPDLEPILGIGTTPAHRGTCYMVVANEDLTDMRGAIPQFQFQVTRGLRIPVVANGVVWPWVSGEVSDPRHPLGNYLYSTNDTGGFRAETGGGPWCTGTGDGVNGVAGFTSLAAAIADLNGRMARNYHFTPFAYSASAGVNLTHNFSIPPISTSAQTKLQTTQYQRWNWLHHEIQGEEVDAICGAVSGSDTDLIFNPATDDDTKMWFTPFSASLWTGWPNAFIVRKGIATLNSTWQFGVQYITGGIGPTCAGQHSAYVPASVRVELQPGPPNAFAQKISGTFRAMRSFVPIGGTANGDPSAFPLDPVVALGDPLYDDQDWWEDQYADAVANSDMAPGLVYGVDYPTAQNYAYFYYDLIDSQTIPITDVIAEICARCHMDSFDTTELEGLNTWGLTITNQYPAYTALQALGQVSMFDGANVSGVLRFVRRGGNTVASITSDDMVDDEGIDFEESQRQDSIAVPRVLHLNYFDIDGGLATDKQSSERPGDRRSVGEQSLSSAVLMDADTAARTVAIQHKVGIEELRGERKFSLPDSFVDLTAADPIFVQWEGENYRVRLTTVEILDGYQQYTAVHDRQSNYVSNVEGIPAVPQTPPPSGIVGPTLLQLLDIHILRDVDDGLGLFFYGAVSGTMPAWQGALIELSLDGGANYLDSTTATTQSIMGALVNTLPDHPADIPDRTHTLRVAIETDDAELLATDLEGMLNRGNLAIVGDELVNFADVDEAYPGIWDLSFLLRGRKGSTTESHAPGTRFVLLDRPLLRVVPANLPDIGRTFTFRATSFGATVEDATIVTLIYEGQSQVERAVGYLTARRDGTDAVVEWQGVGRLGGGAAVAHGARFAGYRVTYDDGTNPAIVADTDDQNHVQDVSGLGSPLMIRVEQLNELTGAGPAAEVSIP